MKGLEYIGAWPSDYELIDCGGFEKLERFGNYVVRRPEPQALWAPSLPADEWLRLADATFFRDARSDDRGRWEVRKGMPERWTMDYVISTSSTKSDYNFTTSHLRLRLALTSFKHVGVFPEQAANWKFIYEQVSALRPLRQAQGPGRVGEPLDRVGTTPLEPQGTAPRVPRVLNLFAYTGGATLAARAAGAIVTHVDSVKQTVSWARDNLILSELAGSNGSGESDGVRWIVDDAMKFVRREVRRGSRYDGIILDPPAYGRGPDGEKWVLEQGLDEMLGLCAQLLDPEGFMVLNLYSMGISAMVARTAVRTHFGPEGSGIAGPADEQFGELFVTDRSDKDLPLGVYYRLIKR